MSWPPSPPPLTFSSQHFSSLHFVISTVPPHRPPPLVSAGSPSRAGDVMVPVPEINQPSLPTPLYPALYPVQMSVSVFMAISTVFLSMNSPDNSPLSHSDRPVLFLPYWSFQLYIMTVSLSPDIILCGRLHQLTN